MLADGVVQHFLAELDDGLADVVGRQQAVAHVVDHLALFVGDVVELQQLLADVEVAAFHLALRLLDGVAHHAVLDRLAVLHAQGLHEVLHPVGGEDAHQVVFQRQVEAAGTRVALATGTATQLVVDTTGFVALGGDHVQAAGLDHLLVALLPLGLDLRDLLVARALQGGHFGFPVAAEEDVGTTTGHVGGDGHGARTTGLGDDLGFLLVVLGVQYLMLDTRLLHQLGNVFGGLDRCSTDQDRPTECLALLDVGDDRVVFLVLGQVDQVVEVLPRDGTVGRDHHHVEAVGLAELEGLGVGGTGHAGQLGVEAEVVLEGSRGEGLAFRLDRQSFLGLDGLVQAFGEAAAGHGAAGVLVDQQDLVALDDVLDVAMEQAVRAQRRVDMGQQAEVVRGIEALAFREQTILGQQFLDELVALLVQFDLAGLLVDAEVALLGDLALDFLDMLLQARNQLVDLDVQLGAVFGLAGDDQRGTRFVDEDGVHFVDHGEVQLALELLVQAEGHVVAQVVEAVFVVGAVGDVGGVGGALLFRRLEGGDDAYAQAKEFVQRTHPVGVTAGQVVVHRDHVHALAGQGVEVHGQGRYQGLALAGAHLGDLALVQGHAADELDVEVAHSHDPLARFARHGEGFREDLVESFALGQARLELFCLGLQLLIGKRHHLGLERIDGLDLLGHALYFTLVLASKEFLQQRRKHIDWVIRTWEMEGCPTGWPRCGTATKTAF
ncbi:hypothetical protein D9M68_392570 [compost metagenome]